MVNVQHIGGGTISVTTGAVTYTPFGSAGSNSNTQGRTQIEIQTGGTGTVSNLGIYVSANTTTADGAIHFQIAGADVNQDEAITLGTTGQFQDSTETDSISDEDDINYNIDGGTGGTTTVKTWWSMFAPTSGTITYITRGGAGMAGTADIVYPIGANNYGNTVQAVTEAFTQYGIGVAGTFQNMGLNLSANSRSENVDFIFRVNAADVNGNIPILTSDTSGFFEDTSETDTISEGDEVNYNFDQGGGTGTCTVRSQWIQFSATDAFVMTGSQTCDGTVRQFSVGTFYINVSGDWGSVNEMNNTTVANGQGKANDSFTWSDCYGYVSVITATGILTVNSFINAATVGNMQMIWVLSGQQADTTDSDSISDEDEFGWEAVHSVTGASTLRNIVSIGSQQSEATTSSYASSDNFVNVCFEV